MRNLIIKRTKSSVGCLMKMKVYIEDPAGELTINDTPCRKLGDLKNGEERTFPIGSEAVKVFVISDKLSKDYCNEYYQLPEGQEDISLSGKNKFNPASGNAFRFDNNESEGIATNRKKGTKKGPSSPLYSVLLWATPSPPACFRSCRRKKKALPPTA